MPKHSFAFLLVAILSCAALGSGCAGEQKQAANTESAREVINKNEDSPTHTPPPEEEAQQLTPAESTQARVLINDVQLSQTQLDEIETTYGVKPQNGEYWYDKVSGLFGVVGHPAFGFMFAGHDYGPLSRDVSNGNTGVSVNGRELPQSEWAVWSQVLGYWIQPGSYWMDHNGNAGYEGDPTPLVNLYAAAMQNAYRGSGGGDNFWSSRFGAGNYDSGNQRGYVSVPGHGPVGYGF